MLINIELCVKKFGSHEKFYRDLDRQRQQDLKLLDP